MMKLIVPAGTLHQLLFLFLNKNVIRCGGIKRRKKKRNGQAFNLFQEKLVSSFLFFFFFNRQRIIIFSGPCPFSFFLKKKENIGGPGEDA